MIDNKFITLAKYGIIESNDEYGNYEIQRIDDPNLFKELNNLDFIPPFLDSDTIAQTIYKNLNL